MSYDYQYTVEIQFHEVDSMNIVHHSQYILWLERARFAYAKGLFGVRAGDFKELGFHLPVVHLSVDYQHSARLDDTVIVQLNAALLEKSALRFDYKLIREHDGKLVARASTEHVFINPEGRLMLQVPEAWRKLHEREESVHYA